MIDRGEEAPPPRRKPDLARALRDAFLQEVGLRGAPEGARIVGRYLLLEPIGEGASGTVWRALHRELLHEVAVKLVPTRQADAPDRIERFRREAATAARLHHPGIVAVHDFGSDDGAHYLAMELVEGRPLDRWLAEEKPDFDRRLALLERVARAAHHAHEQGVVHRDLKPANIVVRAIDAPVIIDFGVARALDDSHLTREGAVVGTIAFMAPEQLRGERDVDARADVWALGMLLHYVATGALPFPIDESPAEALRARLAPAPQPSRVDPSLPRALDVLVRRCLEPDAALRLPSAGALADDLGRLRRGEPILAGATTFTRRLWQRVSHQPLRAALVVGAVIVLVLGARLFLRASRQERELSETRGTLDQKSRELQIDQELLDLLPRLKPLFVRAERARYAARPAGSTAALPAGESAGLLSEIDRVLESSRDQTGTREAYRAWALFLLRPELAAEAFEAAKRRHPDNPVVWLLSGRRTLRRCTDTPDRSPTQPVTYELLVEPTATVSRLHSQPAVKAVVASAREDLEHAQALLSRSQGSVPHLDWARRLCDGFERFAAGDSKAVIERLTPLARNDDCDLEATALLCFALMHQRHAPEAVEQARWLHETHPDITPASRLYALCLQSDARDGLGRGESPTSELVEAAAVFAGAKDSSLIDDILAAQIELDLEVARLFAGHSSAAAWRPIVARWIELRDRTLATDADARARGAAHARVGWARCNEMIFLMPHATVLEELRAATEDYRVAAGLAPDSIWVCIQLVQARARVLEVLARLEVPIEPDEVASALKDVARLRELANAVAPKLDYGRAEADLGEAQLLVCTTLAGDATGATRADAFERAADLAHAAVTRNPSLIPGITVEIECRLLALLARAAPIGPLRAWQGQLDELSLKADSLLDERLVRPLVAAAFSKERGDRVEVVKLAADLARRCARLQPDDARRVTLVVECELALRFVDADHAAAHIDAALACADAFLEHHPKQAETQLARALALAALADLGGRDGLGEEECLEEMREAIAGQECKDEARALLLDLWLARRDGDEQRAGPIAENIAARLAADPDARSEVRTVLRTAHVALELPDAPKEAVAAARAWDELGEAIGDRR